MGHVDCNDARQRHISTQTERQTYTACKILAGPSSVLLLDQVGGRFMCMMLALHNNLINRSRHLPPPVRLHPAASADTAKC